ncbi:MAG TPA: 16S rRNA (guanine(966)-N(2))-methyltransferase RsmD [Candidatus Omnitrophota bacterium]|nr:16S rRNA (guanine(966)-N(2))-methyltransferase RsmD [Candidatus Omnitrophota bacterium]
MKKKHEEYTMRIVAGEFRGRKIAHPAVSVVRPTKDRVREAVFNMMAEFIPGASVLDLFAGSGAYGIEAVSRGAGKTVFVDSNSVCAGTIKSNLKQLSINERVSVIQCDAESVLAKMKDSNERFDVVFADPPYGLGLARKTLISINRYDILSQPGFLVLEHCEDEMVPECEGGISLFKQKKYKDIIISIYRRQ